MQLTLEDALIAIYQNNPSRMLPLSITYLSCSRMRQQWFLYDLISADTIVGSFDQCLFHIQQPQNALLTAHDKTRRVVRPSSCCYCSFSGLTLTLLIAIVIVIESYQD